MTRKRSLLAIDPGLREMGMAHFEGRDLIDYGVKSLRRHGNQAMRPQMLVAVVTRLLREKQPDAVAIEQNDFDHIRQNRQLMAAIRRVHRVVIDAHIPLYAFAPSTIRKAVTGDGTATKFIVAKIICAGNPYLKPYLHREAGWRQRYYFNMFDAIACGLAYLDAEKDSRLTNYANTL